MLTDHCPADHQNIKKNKVTVCFSSRKLFLFYDNTKRDDKVLILPLVIKKYCHLKHMLKI